MSDMAWLLKQYYKRAIFCSLMGAALTWVLVYFFPDQYISRAQVRFIPPQVAEKYVTPNVAMQVDQRIFALTQLVNSRLTGTKMIESFGLYPERRMLSTIADLVPRFQQSLQMKGTTTNENGVNHSVPTIQISFQYSNPAQSQKVVQRVVELIYEENRRYRGEQSIGTTEFLQQEVKKVLDQLTEMEAKISTLPAPTQTITTQYTFEIEELHHVDSRLSAVQKDLRAANGERTLKRALISALEGQIATVDQSPLSQPGSAPPTLSGDRARDMVMLLRAKVDEARARYVVGQHDRVFVEEALSKAEKALTRMEEQEAKLSRESSRELLMNRYVQAKAELVAVESSRSALMAEEGQLKRQMSALRESMSPAPDSELDRLVLNREYAVIKEQYSELTKKQRESQVASNMERRGQGETVELIEPPVLPDSAEQPVAAIRIASGAIAGMAFGMMLGLFSFLRHPHIRTARHLTLVGGITTLIELPDGPALLTSAGTAGIGGRGLLGGLICLALMVTSCASQSADSFLKRGEQLAMKGDYDSAILLYRQALKREPKNGTVNYQLALALQETGQINAARDQYVRAVELLPQRKEALVRLAELTYQIYFGDPGRPTTLLREVEDQAGKLMEMWPKSPEGYRLKTQVLIEQRRPSDAIDLLQKAISMGASDPSLLAQLSAVYYQLREVAKAKTVLTSLLEDHSKYGPGYDLLYLQLMEQHKTQDARKILEKKVANMSGMAVALQLAAHLDASGDRTSSLALVSQSATKYAKEELAQAQAGDFWLHRGLFDKAKEWFESGKLLHPAARNIYAMRLMDMELVKKNPLAAKVILDTELKLSPNDPLLNAYQAALQIDSEGELQRNTARAKLETILTKMPNSSFVRLHLGRAYLRAGELMKASQQLERSVTLDPNYAPGWIALAESDLLSGRPNMANDRLNALLQRAPGYTPALILQAKASLARKRPAEAGESLMKILAQDPNDLEAILTLASAEGSLQHGKEVITLLDRAEKLAPKDARPFLMRAQWDATSGRAVLALSGLQKARDRFPMNSDMRSLTAGLAIRNGNLPLAIKEYKSLMGEFPKNTEFRLGYANALGLSGDRKQAAEEYKKIQQQGGDDGRAWLNYGVLMATAGDHVQAKIAYSEAIKRDKNNGYALNNLAYLMARSGDDLQTALHYAEEAKRSMPRSPEIHDTLTYIYLRMGMTRNASAILEEMMQWLPQQEKKNTEKLLAMIRRGESNKVRSEMERAAVN